MLKSEIQKVIDRKKLLGETDLNISVKDCEISVDVESVKLNKNNFTIYDYIRKLNGACKFFDIGTIAYENVTKLI